MKHFFFILFANLFIPCFTFLDACENHQDVEYLKCCSCLNKVETFNKKTANEKSQTTGNTLLHDECLQIHLGHVQFLIDNDIGVNEINNFQDTPLLSICFSDLYLAIQKILLQNGASVNCKNIDGNTPLHIAVHFKATETVKLLLDNKADVNTKNNVQKTPFMIAQEKKQDNDEPLIDEILQLLTNYGAKE
jgi:ankyrin repeat protein